MYLVTQDELSRKRRALHDRLSGLDAIVVAYSGGVDSAFLATAAHEALGRNALAITAVSPSLARRELEGAVALAAERDWNHRTVGTHEVAREEYARNEPDRCFWCKTELFEVLEPIAEELGAVITTGTNVDDLTDHRPGLVAAGSHSIHTPLVDAGLTKREIRTLSALEGLPTAEKPASPCLASRFAYGVRVTPEGLRRIDRAEEILRALGFVDLRVRDHGELARIEVPVDQIVRAAELRADIANSFLSLGFKYVTLDLIGFRSGSMNEVLEGPGFGSPRD